MFLSHKNLPAVLVFLIIIAGIIHFFDPALLIGLVFCVFLGSLTLLALNYFQHSEDKRVVFLFLILFILHIAIVLFLYYSSFQPFSSGGGDYVKYDYDARMLADRFKSGNFSLEGAVGFAGRIYVWSNIYPLVISILYYLVMPSMLLGQLFNAWFIALSAVLIYFIVREIGGTAKQGFLTGLATLAYPSMDFYGSLLLKDAVVVFLSILGLLIAIKTVKIFSIRKFIYFFIVLTALIHFRFYVGYALMFAFIASWFLASNFKLKKRIVYGAIIVFILGFSPYVLGQGYYGYNNFKNLNSDKITFYREVAYQPSSQAQTQAEPPPPPQAQTQPVTAPQQPEATVVNSTFVVKTGLELPLSYIADIAVTFVYVLMGPFPWQLTPAKYFFVLPEMLLWYFALFFIAKGMIIAVKKRNSTVISLIVFSCLTLGVMAIIMCNFGLITRIRIPAFLALLCLFPFGFKKINDIKLPFLQKFYE